MTILCIDIGNTSIHYGLVSGKKVSQTGDFSTDLFLQTDGKEQLRAVLQPLIETSQGMAFCSVVPALNSRLEKTLQDLEAPLFHLTYQNCPGLPLVYPNPAEIGQDRLANAIAAQAYYGLPAVVIDMGTAVSFDILSGQGYEGGIIAPGIGAITDYLHEQTALLPKLTEEDLIAPKCAIGKSTVEAMQLGVAVGFSGMIDALLRRVILELEKREGKPPVVLATGGSTANLTADWSEKSEFIEHLTLQGLAVAYQRNQ